MLSEISSAAPIIFTIIWQSSLFIAAGLMASCFWKRHPARAHQVLLLSMIAAAAVPFMTITVKHLELGIFTAEPEPAAIYVATNEVSVQPTDNSLQGVEPSVPSVQPFNNPLSDFVPSVPVELEKSGLPWGKILFAGWIAASVIFLARLILTFILGIRVVKKAQSFDYPKIAESIKAAASKLGIKENVVVYSSKSVSSPVIWCWNRRPVLLFPYGKRLLNDKIDLVGIFCHELAHLKRRDHVAGLLSELMVVFLPWHPLLWWSKKQLLSLSEHACDDWVIAAGSCGMDYAESLLDFLPARQMAFVPSVVQNQNVLKGRVMRILKERYGNPRLGKKWILSAVLITTCITLTVAFAQTRSARSEEEPGIAGEEPANVGYTPAGNLPDIMAMEKQRLENPDIMYMERRMTEQNIIEKYGSFFERLGLPDEKIQAFKSLLVDYRMPGEENILVRTDQSLSEEERKEKLQLLGGQKRAEFEKQARDLLGAENYEMYQAYLARLWEHEFVTQYINFPGADGGLSDEKEQELIDAMYEVRKEMETEYGLNTYGGQQFFIGVTSLDATEEERARRLEIVERYIESVRGILSESQADYFEDIAKGMKETMIDAAEVVANGGPSLDGDISDFMAMEQKRLENPDRMNMERTIQEKMIDQKYGALFERLGLSDEKNQDLKTLMVDNEIQTMENRSAPMDQSLPVEEIEQKKQQLKDQQAAEFEKQARDLLGWENYEIYAAYRARLWEHQLVAQVINLPDASGGLTDEKAQELIDAMYEVRKEMEAEYGLDSYDGQQFFIGVRLVSTQEERNRRLEIYDGYIESAWGILSEAQAEQFEDILRGMQETMAKAAEAPSFPPPGTR